MSCVIVPAVVEPLGPYTLEQPPRLVPMDEKPNGMLPAPPPAVFVVPLPPFRLTGPVAVPATMALPFCRFSWPVSLPPTIAVGVAAAGLMFWATVKLVAARFPP